jgi:Transthyretin-like protein
MFQSSQEETSFPLEGNENNIFESYLRNDDGYEYDCQNEGNTCNDLPEEDCDDHHHDHHDHDRRGERERERGSIVVFSKFRSASGEPLSGVTVKLFRLTGGCPQLISSKVTDCNGRVIFDNLPNGFFRVVEEIDKRFFQRPTYIPWNEVEINNVVRTATIIVVNRLRRRDCRRDDCGGCDLAIILLLFFCGGFGFFI